jgi:hypothetical protein
MIKTTHAACMDLTKNAYTSLVTPEKNVDFVYTDVQRRKI